MLPFTIFNTGECPSPLTLDFDKFYIDRISRPYPFFTPRNPIELAALEKWRSDMRADKLPTFEDHLYTAFEDWEEGEKYDRPIVLPQGYKSRLVLPDGELFWSAEQCPEMAKSYQRVCNMSSSQRTTFNKALSESAERFTDPGTEGTKMGSTAKTSSSRRSEDERAWLDEGSTIREREGSEQTENNKTRDLRRIIRAELRSQKKDRKERKEKRRRRRQASHRDSQDGSTLVGEHEGSKKSRRVTINLPASSCFTFNFV
jgi:hypothetical protein